MSSTIEKINEIYLRGSTPGYLFMSKKDKKELRDLIRKEAVDFIKSHRDIEQGLRNLSGWSNGIKFALLFRDPTLYESIGDVLHESTKLISNDL